MKIHGPISPLLNRIHIGEIFIVDEISINNYTNTNYSEFVFVFTNTPCFEVRCICLQIPIEILT